MANWLDAYCKWCEECTDAPSIFHRWTGYVALASAIGRKVTFEFGPFSVALNLYVLLLAPSSIYRKTTALNLSRRIATKVGAYALTGDGSPEGFIEDLRQNPTGTLYYSELASLLLKFDREYAAELKPLLTDLYDCPDTYRRKLRGSEITIQNPSVSILAASTLDWVMDKVRHSDFGGGFLTRFVLVNAVSKERNYQIPPPYNIMLENELVAALRQRADFCKGRVSLDPVAPAYIEWATGFERKARSPLLAAFISRLQIAALKISILEELSESGGIVLHLDSFERAREQVEQVARNVELLEETELSYGSDRDGQDQRIVARILRQAKSMGWSNLLKATRLTTRRLRVTVDTLKASGSVQTTLVPPADGKGRALELVQWKP